MFNPYTFKNNLDFKQQLNSLIYEYVPVVNKNYGKPYKEIFTKELKPNLDQQKLNELNGLMKQMLDNVKTIYFPNTSLKMQPIKQILIYMNGCPACKRFHPYFTAIGDELNKRMRFYHYQTVEINEYMEVIIHGEKVKKTGKQLLDDFHIRGVPIVLQNFVAKEITMRDGKKKHIIEKKPLYVAIEYGMKPFRYVAQTWDIENLYIKNHYTGNLESRDEEEDD